MFAILALLLVGGESVLWRALSGVREVLAFFRGVFVGLADVCVPLFLAGERMPSCTITRCFFTSSGM